MVEPSALDVVDTAADGLDWVEVDGWRWQFRICSTGGVEDVIQIPRLDIVENESSVDNFKPNFYDSFCKKSKVVLLKKLTRSKNNKN